MFPKRSPLPPDTPTPTNPWLDRIPSDLSYFSLPVASSSSSSCSDSSSSAHASASSQSSFSSESSSESSQHPRQMRDSAPFRAQQQQQQPRPASYPTATILRQQPPPSPTPTHASVGYIPPEQPVILEDESPTPDTSGRTPAPYEVFLNRAPQPPDSWLQIETMPNEYRLHARLPAFPREGITLSTKRRRILHLVADKWGQNGGHFERRISFGHDADLVQVRAEFDGEMLRVFIPRRQTTWSNSRIAYSRG